MCGGELSGFPFSLFLEMCKTPENAAEGVGAGGMADLLEGGEDLLGGWKPAEVVDCQTKLLI